MVRRHRRRRVRALGRPSRSPADPTTRRRGRPLPGRRGRLPGRAGDRPHGRRRRHLDRRRHHGSGCARGGGRAEVVYTHAGGRAASARCPRTRRCSRSAHSEHGDSRHPAVRVVRLAADGGHTVRREVRRRGQGADRAGVRAGGRRRAAAAAARAARPRGAAGLGRRSPTPRRSSRSTCPASWSPTSTPTAHALLVGHTHAARTRLHRYDLDSGELAGAARRAGVASGRPRCARTARSSTRARRRPSRRPVRALHADGTDRVLLDATGPRPRRPRCRCEDLWVDGPGAGCTRWSPARRTSEGPAPAVFSLHGGPHAADEDRFSASPRGLGGRRVRVVEVNYRGSTGYGSAWRDAIEGRPGLTELEDVAAVHDHCVESRAGRPEALRGGGLVVGRLPRAARRSARSPSAGRRRWPACRSPTTSRRTPTRWSSCGRSTGRCSAAHRTSVPERYRAASPLTYVDEVRAPVLVLAGENDPRCPIQQVDNYLDALAERSGVEPLVGTSQGDVHYQVSRFDAGPRLARRGRDAAPHRHRDRLRAAGPGLTRPCADTGARSTRIRAGAGRSRRSDGRVQLHVHVAAGGL